MRADSPETNDARFQAEAGIMMVRSVYLIYQAIEKSTASLLSCSTP